MAYRNNKFPLEVLPESLQAIILHQESLSNWDMNSFAVSYISASSTIIGSTVNIDNLKYKTAPNLWMAIITESGRSKSHLMKYPFRMLNEQDEESFAKYEIAKAEWFKLPKKEKDKQVEPKPKGFIETDFTRPTIIQNLKLNEKGLVLHLDEIAAWILGFEKGEKEFYLSMHNGGTLSFSRIGRGKDRVGNSCVNVIGGIQPSKMSLIDNKESEGDGFLQRFLMVRHKADKPNEVCLEPFNQDIIHNEEELLKKVFKYPETTLKVDMEILKAYKVWADENNKLYFLDPLQISYQAKLETAIWRLCIVLDVLDQCENNTMRDTISLDTMEKAIKLVEFFRIEFVKTHQETHNPFQRESEQVKSIYNNLESRVYTTGEISELFKIDWTSPTTVSRKLNKFFTFVKHGNYTKKFDHAQ